MLPFLVAVSCATEDVPNDSVTALQPVISEAVQIVPGPGLPPEVMPQDANNNLDVTWHDDRVFLAFRTAPTHFASAETELYIVSSADEQTWRYEGRFHLETDLREPQLVSWEGRLYLYFAVLGTSPTAFEPQGTMWAEWRGPGDWSEPEWTDDPTFIPWRIKQIDGVLSLVGYTGGGEIYEPDGDPIQVRWRTSTDALTWSARVPGQDIVLEGGGSETDLEVLEDGSLVAVVRNEAGDADGFGSKVCTAPAEDLGSWTCSPDPRKYDSPLVFQAEGRVWLVARRNVTEDGHYDLGMDLERAEASLLYQAAYWQQPKRCALWEVLPSERQVQHVLDLPSKGDTCFPEIIEIDGRLTIYNYSSDPEGHDWAWFEGQTRPTGIYKQVISFE
jgi:hypothetical protein